MNSNKLKGYLREKNKSYSDCSKAIGITITSFSNKLNGKSLFNITEINDLVSYLNMDYNTAMEIFFDKNLY
jgi:hypothetical protein